MIRRGEVEELVALLERRRTPGLTLTSVEVERIDAIRLRHRAPESARRVRTLARPESVVQ